MCGAAEGEAGLDAGRHGQAAPPAAARELPDDALRPPGAAPVATPGQTVGSGGTPQSVFGGPHALSAPDPGQAGTSGRTLVYVNGRDRASGNGIAHAAPALDTGQASARGLDPAVAGGEYQAARVPDPGLAGASAEGHMGAAGGACACESGAEQAGAVRGGEEAAGAAAAVGVLQASAPLPAATEGGSGSAWLGVPAPSRRPEGHSAAAGPVVPAAAASGLDALPGSTAEARPDSTVNGCGSDAGSRAMGPPMAFGATAALAGVLPTGLAALAWDVPTGPQESMQSQPGASMPMDSAQGAAGVSEDAAAAGAGDHAGAPLGEWARHDGAGTHVPGAAAAEPGQAGAGDRAMEGSGSGTLHPMHAVSGTPALPDPGAPASAAADGTCATQAGPLAHGMSAGGKPCAALATAAPEVGRSAAAGSAAVAAAVVAAAAAAPEANGSAAVSADAADGAGAEAAPIGPYSQRDVCLAAREAAGDLVFRYVRNDGQPDNSVWCAPADVAGSRCQ